MLHWVAMRVAAGGVPVLPFFEHYDGLPALLSERSTYIREWVRVFYATVAKMASHATFQYNVFAIDDTHNTWTNVVVKMTILRLFRFK